MLIGIVGKPNVGKSTFFKAATLADVKIADYPFATIEPNHDIGFVRTECVENFFGVRCNPRFGYCADGVRFVSVELMDVAGLVPGAHEGKGMGNQFLNDLNQADALIHVVDASGTTNEKGEKATNYDPVEDVRFLEDELDYWYLAVLKRGWAKLSRSLQHNGSVEKVIAEQMSSFGVKEKMAKDSIIKLKLPEEKPASWNDEQLLKLCKELRLKTKPMLIAANKMDLPEADENLQRLKKEFPHLPIVPCSSDAELALRQAQKAGIIKYLPGDSTFEITGNATDKQKAALEFIQNVMKKYGSTGIQRVLNDTVFTLLGFFPVFPGGLNKLTDKDGRVLPDCFLMPPGSTALDFAYKIHTDIGEKFIRAIDVKTKMTVGKEHRLKAGDVIEIVANR